METLHLRHPPKYFHLRLQVQTNATAWQIVEGSATPAAVFELRSVKQLSLENPLDVTTRNWVQEKDRERAEKEAEKERLRAEKEAQRQVHTLALNVAPITESSILPLFFLLG